MKYIKTYEYKPYEGKYGLEVGDFVQMKRTEKYIGFNEPEKIFNMVNNTIGQIDSFESNDVIIKYKYGFSRLSLRFAYKDIVDSAKTKEELEAKLTAKKYNI